METFECLESTDDKPSILNFVLYFFFGISSQIYTLNGHLGQYKHFGINFNKKEQISLKMPLIPESLKVYYKR